MDLQKDQLIDNKYLIQDKLGEGGMGIVYSAINTEDNQKVAIKFLKPGITSSHLEDIIRFRREVQIVSKFSHPHIIKFYQAGDYQNIPYLVAEYLEGISMSELLETGKTFSVDESVSIIKQMAEALSYVHSKEIIHKDIKPGNIYLKKDNNHYDVKLLDFGLSHIMELSEIIDKEEIAGTFGYMSPESTGVIKKSIDERSDLYSVGVVFYVLLTGQLPYKTTTVGHLLHQIIALNVTPVRMKNPNVPLVLEEVVDKLLNKEQEVRYQSAQGLLYDLNRYLDGDQDFNIGERDPKRKLTYQTKLIGREKEINILKDYINTARAHKGRIVFVSGEPGVGKTRLIREIKEYAYRLGHKRGGLFIEGHCISQGNKVPYQPIKNALDEYINKVRNFKPELKERLINRLKREVGNLGGLLVKLNPRMQELLGDVPDIVALDPEKDNLRFILTLSNFICNLAEEGQACILLIDDLQWADGGTLRLLAQLSTNIDKSSLVIIGTYRDTEVDDTHGLSKLKQSMLKTGDIFTEVKLQPLTQETLNKMIAGLLAEREDLAQELSKYVLEKSGGNPFFAITLLRELVEQKAIVWKDGEWQQDWERIDSIKISSSMSVVDILLLRMKKIPANLRALLSMASTIGKDFNVEILYDVMERDKADIVEWIDDARQLQILDLSETDSEKLQFVHERMREVFYGDMSDEERKQNHRKIGKAIERLGSEQDEEAYIYDLAHHFMEGEDSGKGLQYALEAGCKAKANYDAQGSIKYYSYIRKILKKKNDRSNVYINALRNLGELYRLTGRFDEALESFDDCRRLIPKKNNLLIAEILSKSGDVLWEKGEGDRAIEVLAQALKLLGVKLPHNIIAVGIGILIESVIQTLHTVFPGIFRIREHKYNQRKEIIVHILVRIAYFYYFTDITKCFHLAMKYLNMGEQMGPCRILSNIYATHTVIWAGVAWAGRAKRDGELAVRIAHDLNDRAAEGSAYAYYAVSTFCNRDIEEAYKYTLKSIKILRGIGEYWDIGMAMYYLMACGILRGEKFDKLLNQVEETIQIAQYANSLQTLGWSLYNKTRVLALIGDEKLKTEAIQAGEDGLMQLRKARDNVTFLQGLSYLAFAHLRAKNYDKAIQLTEQMAELFPTHNNKAGFILDVFPISAHIYLECVCNIPNLTETERRRYLRRARYFCKRSHSLQNKFPYIRCYSYQVNGTHEWLAGNKEKAMEIWEQGIKYTRKNTRDIYRLASMLLERSSFLINDNRLSHREKSDSDLLEAKEIFKKLGARLDYHRACALLGEKEEVSEDHMEGMAPSPQERLGLERRMSTVLNTSIAISSLLALDQLLEKIMDATIESVGAERGVLLLYPEDDRNKLEIKVMRNVEQEEVEGREFKISESIISQVERGKTPLLIDDASTNIDLKNQMSIMQSGLKSILCAPILAQGELIGVIYVDNHLVSGLFTEEDLWVLNIITNQAGISIQNARLYKEAVRDGLTNVYNRSFFENCLIKKVNEAKSKKTNLSFMIIDIDYFKQFNDRYGHQAGDLVLKSVSKKIVEEMTSSAVIARYGGDEFVVILPDADLEESRKAAQKLNEAVNSYRLLYREEDKEYELQVTLTIGVAKLRNGQDNLQLIKSADRALYKAKEAGRNRVAVFDDNAE
ncbi:MAG: diguanylate cyclase [Pseudomonadota bacterium]